MRIVDVKIYPIQIPLVEPFKIALGETRVAHSIMVEVVTDENILGYGEASPTARITGETYNQALVNLEYLKHELIGEDPLCIERLEEKINNSLLGSTSVKAALNMALYDILGKYVGKPLYVMFGAYRSSFETDITIGIKDLESTVKDAIKHVDSGFKKLKVKVGIDPKEDIERVKRIRDAIGYKIALRLDANQGWSPKQAVSTIKAVERYEIELVEQPVPYWDIDGLKYVKDNVETPIIADESIHTARDAIELIRRDAVDGLNIKIMKCGGIREAFRIAHVAEARGLKCMIGCMIETRLALSAAAHVVASTKNIVYIDLDGNTSLADEPLTGGIRLEHGVIYMPEAPGLGVELDRDKLEKFKFEGYAKGL